MTCNVFGGTLNLTQSINHFAVCINSAHLKYFQYNVKYYNPILHDFPDPGNFRKKIRDFPGGMGFLISFTK